MEDVDIVATVPLTLSLKLGPPAAFAPMIPGVAATYTASTTATVISTAGSAQLTVTDRNAASPGRLVNGSAVMPQALRARAGTAAYAAVSGTPLSLVSWATPISNAVLTLGFQQPVAATDALRAGQYAKTLTFTLSTTTP